MLKKFLFALATVTMVTAMAVSVQARGCANQGQGQGQNMGNGCVSGEFCQNQGGAMRGYFARGYRVDIAEAEEGRHAYIICPNGERFCMNDERLSGDLAAWARNALDCEFCSVGEACGGGAAMQGRRNGGNRGTCRNSL